MTACVVFGGLCIPHGNAPVIRLNTLPLVLPAEAEPWRSSPRPVFSTTCARLYRSVLACKLASVQWKPAPCGGPGRGGASYRRVGHWGPRALLCVGLACSHLELVSPSVAPRIGGIFRSPAPLWTRRVTGAPACKSTCKTTMSAPHSTRKHQRKSPRHRSHSRSRIRAGLNIQHATRDMYSVGLVEDLPNNR